MLAGITECGDHQVGGAVDDSRLLREIGGRGHETAKLYNLNHPIEITITGNLDLRDQVDGADFRLLVAVLHRGIVTKMPGCGQFAVDKGYLTGHMHHVATSHPGNIVGRWGRCVGNDDAHIVKAGFDGACHGVSPIGPVAIYGGDTGTGRPWLQRKIDLLSRQRKRPRTEVRGQSAGYTAGRDQLQPVVLPQVLHFRQVPLRTRVKFWHSGQASPS